MPQGEAVIKNLLFSAWRPLSQAAVHNQMSPQRQISTDLMMRSIVVAAEEVCLVTHTHGRAQTCTHTHVRASASASSSLHIHVPRMRTPTQHTTGRPLPNQNLFHAFNADEDEKDEEPPIYVGCHKPTLDPYAEAQFSDEEDDDPLNPTYIHAFGIGKGL